MNDEIIAPLEQQRRDALVAYYLGQLVGQGDLPDKVVNENDLYEYLLIDNQVTGEVETSRIAQGIATVQQHVHAIFNGMEPGFENNTHTEAQRDLWRDGMAKYTQWSGYQMLEDYPENYLDPGLRLDQTSLFRTLTGELDQSRLTEDSVQRSIGNYLQGFETVSNLEVLGGYIASADFIGADLYLLGRQRVGPFALYWRKGHLAPEKGSVPSARMVGWTEWDAVTAVPGQQIQHCQPVVMGGRLYVVWAEPGQETLNADGEKTGEFAYSLKLSFLWSNGSWSAPTTVHTGKADSADLATETNADGKVTKGYRLGASTDLDESGKPRLLLYFAREGTAVGRKEPTRDLVVLNHLLNPVVADESLYDAVQFMLGTDVRRLQFPCDQAVKGRTAKWRIKSVVPNRNEPPSSNTDITRQMEVRARWTGGRLALDGICHSKVNVVSAIEFTFSTAWQLDNKIKSYRWEVEVRNITNKELTHTVLLTVTLGVSILAEKDVLRYAELHHEGRTQKILAEPDFKLIDVESTSGYKTYRASVFLELPASEVPADNTAGGAGFTVKAENVIRPLRHPDNYYRVLYSPDSATTGFAHFKVGWLEPMTRIVFNGMARSATVYDTWPDGDAHTRTYQWGDTPTRCGLFGFDVTREPAFEQAPRIVETALGAQFLDLDIPGVSANDRYVRLNTLFGKELSRRAALSLDSVFDWETQHIEEPPAPGGKDPVRLDFKGANSLYFWELFFHTPHLVAWRLNHELDYLAAERWLHKLFNPLVRTAPLYPPPSETEWLPYWTCRPLGFADEPALERESLADPDAISRGAPSHYRKAIFMLYLDNLIAWGDMLYRQLTRDTLGEAKLLYVRALSLLGPLSKGRSISRWEPVPLERAGEGDGEAFALAEAQVSVDTTYLATPAGIGVPWLRLLDSERFRLPVNTRLLDYWDTLDARLVNLRNNLTLDGQPMQLALYELPTDPLDLLRAQQGGSSLNQRRLGSLAIIPPYRFRAMLPRVRNAVETLIGFGDRVRTFMELRDQAEQQELQQGHALELATFAERIQQDAIDQANKTLEVLQATRAGLESRRAYHQRMIDQDVSRLEHRAHENLMATKQLSSAARHVSLVGQLATLIPNLYGLTMGGMNWGAPFFGSSEEIQAKGIFDAADAQEQLTSDLQKRRRDEYEFQVEAAELEIEVLDRQIEAQQHQVRSATTSLAQQTKAFEQAQAMYAFIKNRPAGSGLYQWLLGQMSTLYFQAYDAVLAMCLAAEACWQYEIGDRDVRFVSTTAWADNRFGLTAGETLKLGLLQMESSFLARHERRLEITRTVSLKELLLEQSSDADASADSLWAVARETLRTEGELRFGLHASTFDRDYPGHYLRQLLRVSVSLPVVLGAWQDLHMTLSQQTSSYLLKPQIDNVRYLYRQANELPGEGEGLRTDLIVSNPRPNQQIGISGGVDDHGMFVVDFGDERYYPFEGTGAVSSWTLSFPNHESPDQQSVIDGLTDVILHVRYLAVDGGSTFAGQVEQLLDELEAGAVARPHGRSARRS